LSIAGSSASQSDTQVRVWLVLASRKKFAEKRESLPAPAPPGIRGRRRARHHQASGFLALLLPRAPTASHSSFSYSSPLFGKSP
jgi:hypothetical protein